MTNKKHFVQQFFTLQQGEKMGQAAEYHCSINAASPVFDVHFPSYPVLPGVLTQKMVVDVINESRFFASRPLELRVLNNAKYLAVIDPRETKEVDIKVSLKKLDAEEEKAEGNYHFKATVAQGEKRFATFSFLCQTSDHVSLSVDENEVCAVIPTYNNGKTILKVVEDVKRVLPQVIVVDDGSTDATGQLLEKAAEQQSPSHVLRHPHNKGKGAALRTALAFARAQGFRYAVTIDADGQHSADDIAALLKAEAENPDALVVGSRTLQHENMPGKSTFANRFSNFWFAFQTLQHLPDTQSGLRVYPLHHLAGLRFVTSRYEGELSLLVFAAWAGVTLVPVPVSVYYPPKEERVSHFRPARDFARISVLNTVLCFLAVVYGWPRTLGRYFIKYIGHHPKKC